VDYDLIYFYKFIGNLSYSLGHYRYGGSNVYIRQRAYKRRSALYSHYYGLPKGANIYPDCLYILGILLLGSLGLDKLY